jgi:autotransporter-associated beta strand protein
VITGNSKNLTFNGNSTGILRLDGGASNTYSGLTKVNVGELDLAKTATFDAIAGNLTIGDGIGSVNTATVKLIASDQIKNTSDVTINSDGLFNLNGNSETINALSGNGTITNTAGSLTNQLTSTLTTGGNNGGGTFSGSLQDGGAFKFLALTKTGAGTLTLTGNNPYTGATIINGGTLEAAANGSLGSGTTGTASIAVNGGGTLLLSGSGSDRVRNNAPITLGTGGGSPTTGTIARGAVTTNEGTGASKTAGVVAGTSAVGLGALTLASNSTIDFGTGTVGTLTFASFAPAGFTLNILNWTGTASGLDTTTSGVDGTADRLIFNQDQTSKLAFFSFNGVGATQISLDSGFYEIVPLTAIPEPSTWIGAALALGAIGVTQLRKRSRAGSNA